ncbi:hypothetical protein [Chitinophaga pinensis]|uniref:hypothetical protein n=1 Tax=Chitinophaga pinensis TaxID=79329 RepID=UPI0016484F7C|nr:hypothetical protein [Chitinophaga pinensis]
MDQLLGTIMVRTKAGMEQAALAKLSAFYKVYNPDFPFEYKFLDDDYQAQYIAEKRVAALSRYFSGLAMLISCLGLLGLTASHWKKEVKRSASGRCWVLPAAILYGCFPDHISCLYC